MQPVAKPFVHITINAVDAVLIDREGHYDPEFHDHYATFHEARDAALTSVELMLDEEDYDGEDHRQELERMREMLEEARSFADLESLPSYQWFLGRLDPTQSAA